MRAFLALALVAALATSAYAGHGCTTYETSQPEFNTGSTTAGQWYVDFDFGDIFSVWIYEESNGIAGLQRGDEIVDDTCHGLIRSDTIIF